MPGNFTPGANTFSMAGNPVAQDEVIPTQLITGDGAITIKSGLVLLSKASAAAITIAPPDQDGQVIMITTKTAQAHVLTAATGGFNNKGSSGTITWTAAKGNSVMLVSQSADWYVFAINGVTVA
jgi:hypothetical protein